MQVLYLYIYILKSNKNLDWGITLESVYSNLTLSLIQIKNCSFTSIFNFISVLRNFKKYLEFSEVKNTLLFAFVQNVFKDIQGSSDLITMTNSNATVINCTFENIFTYSPYIFEMYYSNIFISNNEIKNFYPQFLFGTFSSMTILNNLFANSYDQLGMFEVGAILLQHNATFKIINNTFFSLRNSLFGPVSFVIK